MRTELGRCVWTFSAALMLLTAGRMPAAGQSVILDVSLPEIAFGRVGFTDHFPGNAFVHTADGAVLEITPAGSISTFIAPTRAAATAGHVLWTNNTMFISDRTTGQVDSYDTNGVFVATLESGLSFSGAADALFGPDDFIYVSDGATGGYDFYQQVDQTTGYTGTDIDPSSVFGGGVRQSTIANDGLWWISIPSAAQIQVVDFNTFFTVQAYTNLAGGGAADALDRMVVRRSDGHIFAWYENSKLLLELDPAAPAGDAVILNQYDLSGAPFTDGGESFNFISIGPGGNIYMTDNNRSFTSSKLMVFDLAADPPPPPAFTQVDVEDVTAFSFSSSIGVNYRLQSMPAGGGSWSDSDYTIFGTGGEMLAFDTTGTGITTAKNYRVQIETGGPGVLLDAPLGAFAFGSVAFSDAEPDIARVGLWDGSVVEVSEAGTVSPFIAANRAPVANVGGGVLFTNDHYYVADRTTSSLNKYDTNGVFVSTVASGLGNTYDTILGPDGFIYVSTGGVGNYDDYQQIDLATGLTGVVLSPAAVYGGGVRESTIANDGLWWISIPSQNTIKVLDFTTTNEVQNYDGFMPGSPGSALDRMTVRRSDGHIFAWQENAKNLIELDPSAPAGAAVILNQYDLSGASWLGFNSISVAPDGNIYITDSVDGGLTNLKKFDISGAPPIGITETNVADVVSLEFQSRIENYRLQTTTDLVGGTWTETDYKMFGSGAVMHTFDPSTADAEKNHRIMIVP